MDEDRLTPGLGRLIDAAKAVMRATEDGAVAGGRAEGWAVLGLDGKAYVGRRLAEAAAGAAAARTEPEAAAFAVTDEQGDTLLPTGDWRAGAEGVDPELPVAVKYLGRWILVTLGEMPGASEEERPTP